MPGLSPAAPGRIIAEYQLLACTCNGVLPRQPCHIEDRKPSPGPEHPPQVWQKLLCIKIEKALARCDHIKSMIRKIHGFRRASKEIDLHTRLFCEPPGLFNLFR